MRGFAVLIAGGVLGVFAYQVYSLLEESLRKAREERERREHITQAIERMRARRGMGGGS